MSVRNLEFLFQPRSVAVVGASDQPGNRGTIVLRNLVDGGFAGPILPVAVRDRSLFGLGVHAYIGELPQAPDLAVICAPPDDVPEIIDQLGSRGTRAVIVGAPPADPRSGGAGAQRQAILEAARPHLMRVLGPGSGGLIVPGLKLNASFAHLAPPAGRIALVSQSAAVASAVLDHAATQGIGLSCAIHLGGSADVDLADVLDYLASDPGTGSILMHFENVEAGRKFMSAVRAAARNKPVVAIRPGRPDETPRVASTRGGALMTGDDVYDAVLRRAGAVRLFTTEGLFDAAESLARVRPSSGDRLAILSNGTGFGRIAADVLARGGGRSAVLGRKSIAELGEMLPAGAACRNPVALPADVAPERYAEVLRVLLRDEAVDAVLTVHAPSAFSSGTALAEQLGAVARESERNVLSCWVGGRAADEARRAAAAQGLPSYESPEKAVGVFLGIASYRRNRALLMEMPPSVPAEFVPDVGAAHAALAAALEAARDCLNEREVRMLLHAYGIEMPESAQVRTTEDAVRAAQRLGYPVVMRVEVAEAGAGSLICGASGALETADDVRAAARSLRARARSQCPGSRVRALLLQRMPPRPRTDELMIAVATDAVFGPLIAFGRSVRESDPGHDHAFALPPLNMLLADDLLGRTRFGEALLARGEEAQPLRVAVCRTLLQVAQMIADVDEIVELEIDPLVAEGDRLVAWDAQVRIAASRRRGGSRRFAIRPYPKELEETVVWQGRRLRVRPIRPEDEIMHGEFLGSLDVDDVRYRFFSTMRRLPRSQLARFTQIDYDREMAFVALEAGEDGVERTLGEVRAVADPDNVAAEFAIVVRSDLKGGGLGMILLEHMIAYCRSRGTQLLRGETLLGNDRMQRLAKHLGFTLTPDPSSGTVQLELALRRGARGVAGQ